MFTVTRRVSFSVVIALLLGWGAMSFMIFRSSEYLIAAELEDGTRIALPRGVKLSLQVDKKIYRSGEPILIALRNDSRLNITLATSAAGCPETWWVVQRLGNEENDWRTLELRKGGCARLSSGREAFAKGTLRTAEWNGLVQTDAIGEVYQPAQTGTYRIVVPYLTGKAVEEKDWSAAEELIASPSFTIQ